MPKIFKTLGKIYFLEDSSKQTLHPYQLVSSIVHKRRMVYFEIDGLPLLVLYVLPNIKKIPSKIVLDGKEKGDVLFCGVLEKEINKEGWDIVVEYSLEYLLQLLDHEPYLTEKQKEILLKKLSE